MRRIKALNILVKQRLQLVSHIDHHHLLACTGQGGDLALDSLGHTRVDGSTKSTVRSHTNDDVLAGLVLRSFDFSPLIQG